MSIIYQKNKKTGVTYAYESKSVWVPELKQPRAKRTYLGKVAPDGSIIPPSKHHKEPASQQENPQTKALIAEIQEKDIQIQKLTEENNCLREALDQIRSVLNELQIK